MPNYGTMPARRWSSTHLRMSSNSDSLLAPSPIIPADGSNKKGKSKATADSSVPHMFDTSSTNGRDTSPRGPSTPLPTPAVQDPTASPRSSKNGNGVDVKERTPRPRSRRFIGRIPNPTLRLENSGSVARDHLASERTFLAYVRTSLALASTGVALVQLFTVSAKSGNTSGTAERIQKFAPALGATIISLGITVLIIGVIRFFTVQFALVKGNFPVARLFIGFIAAILAVLIVIVFGVMVAGRR